MRIPRRGSGNRPRVCGGLESGDPYIHTDLKLILDELNADSAAQPVWIGKADVHYIFVWNTDALTCVLYEVISCGIGEQAYRKAQYFQFVTSLNDDMLHVFHNHSPSSDARKLTDGRRKKICPTCWHNIARRRSAAQPAVVLHSLLFQYLWTPRVRTSAVPQTLIQASASLS